MINDKEKILEKELDKEMKKEVETFEEDIIKEEKKEECGCDCKGHGEEKSSCCCEKDTEEEIGKLKAEVEDWKQSYLRKQADFQNLTADGQTPIFLAEDGKLIGLFGVADQVKADSADMVAALHQMGKEVIMLTGDNDQTAQAIAQKVGIKRVISQVLPQEKSRVISDLQAEGKSVIMVGDGINDAPALATADIGIAMGSGTDIAMESADMVLMKPNLMDVVKALKISQATITTIKENLFWAFIYNILSIPVAMGVLHLFGGPLLDPMIAGLAMSFSSVSVVLNALRLKRRKV